MIKLLLLTFALTSCAHINPINKIKRESTNNDVYDTTKKSDEIAEVIIHETPRTLNEAIDSPYRSDLFKDRDLYRNPMDTLTFFRVKPTQKVLEITPETAWYSEILAPYLNDRGQYIMANTPRRDSAINSNHFLEWSKKYPDIAKNIQTITFDLSNSNPILTEESSVDVILTFKNISKWIESGKEDVVFESFFKVLKNGGILGVVEYRAPKDSSQSNITPGQIREIDVIRMAQKAGFRYYGKSEVNSNPKDTKDYEKGESDRMTLKFVKP